MTPRRRWNTSPWLSAFTTTRDPPYRCAARWRSSPRYWTSSDNTSRQPPSPGFAHSPLTAVAFPELTTAITHLRDVLGDETYESLARNGEAMTTAAMATYAYDQIDQARAELSAVSK